MQNDRTNQLYVDDHILIKVEYPTPEKHAHLAIHLLIASCGILSCQIYGQKVEGKAILIASCVEHTCCAKEGKMLVFLFDETSVYAEYIKENYLCGRAYCVLEEALASEIQKNVTEDLPKFDIWIRKRMGLLMQTSLKIDKRIDDAITYLKERRPFEEDMNSVLSRNACLSKSRFSHLFKQETGVPLNRYLVMVKMRKTYEFFLDGESLTEACVQAGFDSPSHFAATCKKMFGISFSMFRKTI